MQTRRAQPQAAAAAATVLLLLLAPLADARIWSLDAPLGARRALHAKATTTTTPKTLDLTATGTVSATAVSPAIIGLNAGHRYPGSNWMAFFKRTGVNGARLFTSMLGTSSSLVYFVGSANWGRSLSGAAVTSQATLDAAIRELRSPGGHSPTAAWAVPIQWAKYDAMWKTTDTSSLADQQEGNYDATLSTLSGLGITPLVVFGLGLGSIKDSHVIDNSTAAYWASRWEHFKAFYAFSTYTWARGVTRIEPYNEPDLDNDFQLASGAYDIPLWLETYALRARAIREAYADLSAEQRPASPLAPSVHVGAYAKTQYNGGKLGQPTVQAMHRTFGLNATSDPAVFNMQVHSYHSYGQGGGSILANFNELLANASADRAAQGGFGFSVTEFNAKTSGDFSTISANMDQAAQGVKLGSQALNYASAGKDLTSIYAFKFSVTLSNSNGVTKNGIHWGDNTAAPFQVGDSTLGAEALRLVAEKLSGARPLLDITSTQAAKMNATAKAVAVKDGTNAYYIHVVNTASETIRAAVGMAAWGIPAGAPVIVERVNDTSYGEVTEVLAANATSGVFVNLPPDNLVRLTVPISPLVASVPASLGVQVRAGGMSATTWASSPRMCVGSDATLHNNTQASLIKFSLPAGRSASSVKAAVLKLTLSSLSANLATNMTMLLLGVAENEAITNTTASWSSLSGAGGPLLPHPPVSAPAGWALDSINKNFINYAQPGIAIVGHITLPYGQAASSASGLVRQVDVTSFVRASSGKVSFLLVRPLRRNLEKSTGDTMAADTLNAGATACWSSTASAVPVGSRPTLLLY